MIAFKVNNTFLDLFPDTSVTMELNSPLFENDVLPGAFSYPVKFPLTNNNRKALNYIDSLQNTAEQNEKLDCIFYLSGNEYLSGKLKITGVDVSDGPNDSITGNFLALIGDIAQNLKDKSLKDYDFGTYGTDLSVNNYVAYVELQDAYAISQEDLEAHLFDGSTVPGSTVSVNYNTDILTTIDDFVSAWNTANDATVSAERIRTNIIAFHQETASFVRAIVDSPITPAKIIQIYSVAAQEAKDVITGSYPTYKHTFYTYKNIGVSPNDNFLNYINYYDGEKFILDDDSDAVAIDSIGAYLLSPSLYLMHVLSALLLDEGYQVDGDFIDEDEFKQLVIHNNFTNDKRVQISPGNIYHNVGQGFINYTNHVPDIKAAELINSIRLTFAVGVFINNIEKKIIFKSYNNVLDDQDHADFSNKVNKRININVIDNKGYEYKYTLDSNDALTSTRIQSIDGYTVESSVNAIADLPTTGTSGVLRLVTDLNEYYYSNEVSESSTTIDWSFFSENLLPYVTGEGLNKINIKTSTTSMINETDEIDSRGWLVPYVSEQINSDEHNTGENDFGFRMLFYRGLQDDENGDSYPLASYDVYDYDGNQISGANHSLRFDGENGLYAKRWKKWTDFLNTTKPVQRSFNLNELDLIQLDLSKKVYDGTSQYLIKKVRFTITNSGISPVKMDLFRI